MRLDEDWPVGMRHFVGPDTALSRKMVTRLFDTNQVLYFER
jgi:hypothetical protein